MLETTNIVKTDLHKQQHTRTVLKVVLQAGQTWEEYFRMNVSLDTFEGTQFLNWSSNNEA